MQSKGEDVHMTKGSQQEKVDCPYGIMSQPEEYNHSVNTVSIKEEVEDGIEANTIINEVEDPVIRVDLKFEEDSLNYERIDKDPEIEYSCEMENSDEDKKSAIAQKYEKKVQQTRAERIAFLKSLQIEEVKAELIAATKAMKGRGKYNVKKVYKRVPRSLRKSNSSVNYSEDALYDKMMVGAIEADEKSKLPVTAYEFFMRDFWIKMEIKEMSQNDSIEMSKLCRETWKYMTKDEKQPYLIMQWEAHQLETELRYEHSRKENEKTISLKLEFEDAIFEGSYANYVQDVDICEPKSEPELIYDKSVLESLTLKKSHVSKITPERITALAFYPSSENIILAAGSLYGKLGIWNAVSESKPYGFKSHADSITHLAFNPYNPVKLITSSLDGTLRCCDMKKHIFSEICKLWDPPSCTNFDILSPTTYLIAQDNEEIALIDTRTESFECEKKHSCNEVIQCVNVHPVNKSIFLTGGHLGRICLWDLRNLQKQPVSETTNHHRCVQSANFSPVTGNFILSSSPDSICICDSSNLTDVKLQNYMKFRGVNDPLSSFKATWLPHSEESFTVGNKEIPRKIQIYNKNLDVLHSIMHEDIVCSLQKNVFHPFKPFIVGSNISGRIFVFTNLE